MGKTGPLTGVTDGRMEVSGVGSCGGVCSRTEERRLQRLALVWIDSAERYVLRTEEGRAQILSREALALVLVYIPRPGLRTAAGFAPDCFYPFFALYPRTRLRPPRARRGRHRLTRVPLPFPAEECRKQRPTQRASEAPPVCFASPSFPVLTLARARKPSRNPVLPCLSSAGICSGPGSGSGRNPRQGFVPKRFGCFGYFRFLRGLSDAFCPRRLRAVLSVSGCDFLIRRSPGKASLLRAISGSRFRVSSGAVGEALGSWDSPRPCSRLVSRLPSPSGVRPGSVPVGIRAEWGVDGGGSRVGADSACVSSV